MNDVTCTGKLFLCLDGCGTLGYSEVMLLNTIKHRIQRKEDLSHVPRPCDRIDLIGGSGMGGILALLLGRFKMGTIPAILQYEWFSNRVFGHKQTSVDKAAYNSDIFESAFRELATRAGYNADDPMEEENATCKTVIFVMNTRNTEVQAIRSYRIRSGPNTPCTILQAARAAMASPDLFSSVHVGNELYGSELIACFNNPVKLVLKEAGSLFPNDAKVAGVLSLGVGKKHVVGIPENPQPKDRMTILTKVAEDSEGVHQEVAARYKDNGIYYRLNVEHGLQHIEKEEWKSYEDVRRMTLEYLLDEVKKLEAVVNILGKRIGGPYLRDLNRVPNQEIVFPPPPALSRNFVGREDLVNELLKYHFTAPESDSGHCISVIWGVGGIGKTQTSVKLWLGFKSKNPNTEIFFLDARSKVNLENNLRTLIRSRDPKYWRKDHNEALKWLSTTTQKWFIILDNADDPEFDLDEYIPTGCGNHIVITTRNPEHKLLAPDSNHQIDSLSPEESTRLLLSASQSTDTPVSQGYAKDIVADLHHHSLAIVQAAGYVLKHGGLSRYLTLFREQRDRMLLDKNIKLPGYKHTTYATLQLSFDKLPDNTKNILQILSFLNHAQIDEDIISRAALTSFIRGDLDWMIDSIPFQRAEIQKAVDRLSNLLLCDGEWDQYSFNQSISPALQYSLLMVYESDDDRNFYSMHALVQSFLHYTIGSDKPEKASMQSLAARLVTSSIKPDWSLPHFVFNQQLLPHLRALQPDFSILPVDHYDIAVILDDNGAYHMAELHLSAALDQLSDLGENSNNRFVLRIKSLLGADWRAQGKYAEAQTLEEEVVRLSKEILGEEHSDTLSAMALLGQTYLRRCNYSEAIKMYKTVLDIRRKLLGEEHLETVQALNTVGMALSHRGDYIQAVEIQTRVCESHKKIQGEEHQDYLSAMNNLGTTLARKKDYAKAVELLTRTANTRKKLLGEEHPYTLNTMNHLGHALSGQGQYSKAMDLQTKVLEDLRRVHGEEHPKTLLSMNYLGLTLWSMGDYSKATDMQTHVLEVQKRVLGAEHSDTIASDINLARTLSDQAYRDGGGHSSQAKAMEMQTRTLEICQRVFGDEHTETLRVMNDLGVSLSRTNDREKAIEIQNKVMDIRGRVLGDDHPDTLTSMHDLAVTLSLFGQDYCSESVKLFEQVVKLRTKVLTADHPLTLSSKEWYLKVSGR